MLVYRERISVRACGCVWVCVSAYICVVSACGIFECL